VFWGCSNYPRCDFTTNFEPLGAVHDADEGPVARRDERGICLRCGAAVELPDGDLIGRRLAGGPPDPQALAKPARGGRRTNGRRNGTGRGGRGARRASAARTRAAASEG
jgi:hypothetical protein